MERTRLPLMVLFVVALVVAGAAVLGTTPVQADTEAARQKLVDHPLKDAKPGEYLRTAYLRSNGYGTTARFLRATRVEERIL